MVVWHSDMRLFIIHYSLAIWLKSGGSTKLGEQYNQNDLNNWNHTGNSLMHFTRKLLFINISLGIIPNFNI